MSGIKAQRLVEWGFGGVLLGFASVCAAADAAAEFRYLGAYSNMRFTEEHQYGSEVELWAAGDDVVGFFYASDGLIGDTPTGTLADVAFDARTGDLVFTSKITAGSHHCRIHHDLPSRDLFKFDGTLSEGALTGELLHVDALHDHAVMSREQLTLTRTDRPRATADQRLTLSEFEARARAVPEFRRPKW